MTVRTEGRGERGSVRVGRAEVGSGRSRPNRRRRAHAAESSASIVGVVPSLHTGMWDAQARTLPLSEMREALVATPRARGPVFIVYDLAESVLRTRRARGRAEGQEASRGRASAR